MIGYPFDSHLVYEDDGTPIYDRAVNSAQLRKLYRTLYSNGVLPDAVASEQLLVREKDEMIVEVAAGFCIAHGVLKWFDEPTNISIPQSEDQDRIDTVVVRMDDTTDIRSCELYVLKGQKSNNPKRPELTRTDTIWELGLADIFVPKNSYVITQDRITDTRAETERCGFISPLGEFDTQFLYEQIQADLMWFKENSQTDFNEWFERIRGQLSEDAAGHLQNQIDTICIKLPSINGILDYGEEGMFAVSDGKGGIFWARKPRIKIVGNNFIEKGDFIRCQDYFDNTRYFEQRFDEDYVIFNVEFGIYTIMIFKGGILANQLHIEVNNYTEYVKNADDVEIGSFSESPFWLIENMMVAERFGLIDSSEHWNTGDSRIIRLNEMEASGSYEYHAEQDVKIQLVQHNYQVGAFQNNWVVSQSPLAEGGAIANTSGSLASQFRYRWLKYEYINAFPNEVKRIIKYYNGTDRFFIMDNNFNGFAFFNSAENKKAKCRVYNGSDMYTWTSSTYSNYNPSYFYYINYKNGSTESSTPGSADYGLGPCFCI